MTLLKNPIKISLNGFESGYTIISRIGAFVNGANQ
jgi:hypothetical protein